ncbi:hypothetical protein MO973_37350 [Paenibacillus sp. TRM 82003]|uniref:hypothetical protein n=1 Tax=Kineococcus sp. TRM81007 TaxID=2925831 RepID=UPI001F565729|nr:hypothetical protein [Kineococcus sp. TRM81007]MCI2239822.1 hypothetical protein [Kineococcus sp. TRM81007]MCI3925875.1 hypothetical protein [Paenibacillus sp. TRM 82003]
MSSSSRTTDPAVLTRTLTSAVRALAADDGGAFEDAGAALAAFDAEAARTVLGWLLRGALEELHPDGLDADDLRAVVERCARSAPAWFTGLDPHLLVLALTGALGEHPEVAETPRAPHEAVLRHALLLVADLVAATRRPLSRHVEAALAEVRRAETVEMP